MLALTGLLGPDKDMQGVDPGYKLKNSTSLRLEQRESNESCGRCGAWYFFVRGPSPPHTHGLDPALTSIKQSNFPRSIRKLKWDSVPALCALPFSGVNECLLVLLTKVLDSLSYRTMA